MSDRTTPSIENFRAYDPAPKERYDDRRLEGEDDPHALIPNAVVDPRDPQRILIAHTRLMSLFTAELDRQSYNRKEMEVDEDFVDHEQWTELEAELLEEIGYTPMTINVVATTVNWLLGTERRGRTDYKILPRRKEGGQAAELKSHLLKYIADVNRTEFAWSKAFAEAIKAGVGWIECGVQNGDDGEPIYERAETWRNMLWDSAALEDDLEDARYQFRFKWMDVDQAKSFFDGEDAHAAITLAAETAVDLITDGYDDPGDSHENYLNQWNGAGAGIELVERPRVRMIEAWVKLPVKETRMRGGDFRGEIFDPHSPGHVDEINTGRATLAESVTSRMFVIIFTSAGIVWHSPSPYRHNRYPFTPIWGYRRAKTRQPYGIVRGLRDLQRSVNKRHAHALHLLVHERVVMDQGAVDDIGEMEREIGRTVSIIEKRPGYFLQFDKQTDLSAANLELMSTAINLIQQASGVTDESLGRTTNASSGKAIIARQEQGALATAPLFDNLRLARQLHGEKMLSLIEQFVSEEKSFRVTNKRGNANHVTVNDGLPENDIVRTKADFIISEDQAQATLRQANALMLGEIFSKLPPEIMVQMLDLWLELMDIANRDEIVKRVRSINGQDDPDADPDAPNPERDAREAMKVAEQEYQIKLALAELAKVEGEAAAKAEQARKTGAEADKLAQGDPMENIGTMKAALEYALTLINAAPAADTADAVLAEAGYVGANAAGIAAGAPDPSLVPPPEPTAPGEPGQSPAMTQPAIPPAME